LLSCVRRRKCGARAAVLAYLEETIALEDRLLIEGNEIPLHGEAHETILRAVLPAVRQRVQHVGAIFLGQRRPGLGIVRADIDHAGPIKRGLVLAVFPPQVELDFVAELAHAKRAVRGEKILVADIGHAGGADEQHPIVWGHAPGAGRGAQHDKIALGGLKKPLARGV